MNITITPSAATDDAVQIDTIVKNMEASMKQLDETIKSTIPEGIQTEWSETVRENWESYYRADVPAAMEDMRKSAENLKLAVEKALAYSREQGN